MRERTVTALLCAVILLPLALGAWLVHRRTLAREAMAPHDVSVDVVVHQPAWYDSVYRDSVRRGLIRPDHTAPPR